MDIEKMFKEYKQNCIKMRIAKLQSAESATYANIKQEVETVDLILTELEPMDMKMLDMRFRKGYSYDKVAFECNFAKSTVIYKIKNLINKLKMLQ